MNAINETAPHAYFKIVGVTVLGLLFGSLVLSVTGAIIATALDWNGWLVAGSIIASATLIATLLGLDALHVARDLIITQVAAHVSKRIADAKKTEAEADKLLAEADKLDAETALKHATLTTLPLPQRVIPVTLGEKGEGIPLELIHGFDERDLAFLCRQVARHNYTEDAMEKLELPYSRKPMGKAQAGTLYTLFMDLCVQAKIIEGRKPKFSGTLVVTDPLEMMRLIKTLPNVL